MMYAQLKPTRRAVLKAGAASLVGFPAVIGRARSKVTLNFWNWWDITRKPLMEQIISAFEQKNPGVTVNDVVQSFTNREETVVTAMSSGKPPFQVLMATRQELVNFADAGRIVPITHYVKKNHVDLSKFYPNEIKSMWWRGQLYSMPMPTAGGETGFIWYNKDLFQQAGLDPNKPPQTWDAMDSAARALTKRNSDGSISVLGANIGGIASDPASAAASFLAWLYCNGGSLYSKNLKKVAFNDGAGQQTLEWMVDFINRNNGGAQHYADFTLSSSSSSGQYPFYQNRLGMDFFNVSSFFQIPQFAPHLNFGVSLRPYNSKNHHAESHGVAGLTFGWGYVIPKGLPSDVQDAAYRWVEWITYQNNACTFMAAQDRPSPLVACNSRSDFYKTNKFWPTVLQSLKRDVSLGIVPPQTQILTRLGQGISAAIYGKQKPKDALKQSAEQAQALLDQYWATRS